MASKYEDLCKTKERSTNAVNLTEEIPTTSLTGAKNLNISHQVNIFIKTERIEESLKESANDPEKPRNTKAIKLENIIMPCENKIDQISAGSKFTKKLADSYQDFQQNEKPQNAMNLLETKKKNATTETDTLSISKNCSHQLNVSIKTERTEEPLNEGQSNIEELYSGQAVQSENIDKPSENETGQISEGTKFAQEKLRYLLELPKRTVDSSVNSAMDDQVMNLDRKIKKERIEGDENLNCGEDYNSRIIKVEVEAIPVDPNSTEVTKFYEVPIETPDMPGTNRVDEQNSIRICIEVPPSQSSNSLSALSFQYCPICNKKYQDKDSEKECACTFNAEKPYFCNMCDKSYKQKHHLQNHMRIHTGERPYCCDVCDKAFSSYGNLWTHSKIHTGDKPHSCEICKKTFLIISKLWRHMRTHTGEKPYCCDVCNRYFSDNSALRQHMRTHTGDRPYCCDICQKTFTASSGLRTHRRSHTGERPYCCKVCKKGFSGNSNLRKHMRIHTGEKPYCCSICNKTFADKSSIRRHTQGHARKIKKEKKEKP